jgi:hypothetical protein
MPLLAFRNMAGVQHLIQCDESLPVSDVKKLVSAQFRLGDVNIRLLYRGKELENSSTVSQIAFDEGTFIVVVTSHGGPSGRAAPPPANPPAAPADPAPPAPVPRLTGPRDPNSGVAFGFLAERLAADINGWRILLQQLTELRPGLARAIEEDPVPFLMSLGLCRAEARLYLPIAKLPADIARQVDEAAGREFDRQRALDALRMTRGNIPAALRLLRGSAA